MAEDAASTQEEPSAGATEESARPVNNSNDSEDAASTQEEPSAGATEESARPVNNSNDSEDDKDNSDNGTSGTDNNIGNLSSPEGVLILSIAAIFDVIGFVPAIGGISDIIAGIFFSLWMIGTSKKGWSKFILAFILEAIPIVSDVTPFISLLGIFFNIKLSTSWIGCVYSVLMGGSGTKKIKKGGGGISAVLDNIDIKDNDIKINIT